ncbi:MAG TPA: hypothetical protein VGB83_12185 [Actinomycetota bacterium]
MGRNIAAAATWRRAGTAIVLAGALVCTLLLPAEAGGGLVRVGALPLKTADRIVPDRARNGFVAISGQASLPLTLTRFDAASLKATQTAELPYFGQGWSTGHPTVYAFDEAQRVLYVVGYDSAQQSANFAAPKLLAVDADTFAVESAELLATVVPQGVRILGMRLQSSGRLSLVGQVVAGAGSFGIDAPRALGVVLVDVDPRTLSVLWGPNTVRGCQAPIVSKNQADVVRVGDRLFIGCATSAALIVPMPGAPAIVEIPAGDPAAVKTYFLPGSYANGDVFWDPAGKRIALVGSSPGRPAQAVWVFDVRRRLYLGQVASGDLDILSSGLDPVSGRIYTGISATGGSGALLVSRDRGLEIPQAVAFDVHATFGVITPLPWAGLAIIPVLPPGGGLPELHVYRDGLASSALAAGAPLDFRPLDELTVPVPQYAADVQAFGLRVKELGGVNGIAQNLLPNQNLNYWDTAFGPTGVKDGNREIYYARVQSARLSEADASVSAIASQVDEGTDADSETITGDPQSTQAAECRDFGAGASVQPGPNTAVACSLAGGVVEASTANAGAVVADVVAVGAAFSHTKLTRDEAGVLRATVHAEVQNVIMPAGVVIGYASSDVTVTAGREGKAEATYRRTFRNVRAGEFSCDEQCDVAEVARALTEAVGSQIRVDLPHTDRRATPGGSHAHAFRDPWEHQQDIVVNNQGVTALEVPALRLTFVNDNAVASRVIVDLAATKADATSLTVVPSASVPTFGGGSVTRTIEILRDAALHRSDDAAPPSDRSVARDVLLAAGHGWVLLFTPGAWRTIAKASLWFLFAAPLFLGLRRRVLTRTLR